MKLSELPSGSDLLADCIDGNARALRLLPLAGSMDSLAGELSRRRGRPEDRVALIGALEAQLPHFHRGRKPEGVFELLRDPSSVAVTAWIPAAPAGGNLSALLKCVTAVRLAAGLVARGMPAAAVCLVMPPEEISDGGVPVLLPRRGGEVRPLPFPVEPGEGDWLVAPGAAGWIDAVADGIPGLPAPGWVNLLRESHRAGTPLRRACGSFLAGLLGDCDLVFADPLTPEFRGLLPENQWDIRPWVEEFPARNAELRAAGYGTRGLGWPGLDPAVVAQAWAAACAGLPAGVWIADASDAEKLALLLPLCGRMAVPEPAIWPALSATLLDPRSRRLLARHSWTLADLFLGRAAILERTGLDAAASAAEAGLDELTAEVLAGGGPDGKGVDTGGAPDPRDDDARKRMAYQLGKIRSRFLAEAQVRRETILGHYARLAGWLAPMERLQAEALNLAGFLGRYPDSLPFPLLAAPDIHRFEHQIVETE